MLLNFPSRPLWSSRVVGWGVVNRDEMGKDGKAGFAKAVLWCRLENGWSRLLGGTDKGFPVFHTPLST